MVCLVLSSENILRDLHIDNNLLLSKALELSFNLATTELHSPLLATSDQFLNVQIIVDLMMTHLLFANSSRYGGMNFLDPVGTAVLEKRVDFSLIHCTSMLL